MPWVLRRGELGGAWRRRRLGGANELDGTAKGGLRRAGDDGVRAVPARQDVDHGDELGEMSGATGEESDAQRLEREAKQKEEADEAARNQFPPPPPPMTQQNFLQYMQMMEERQRITMEQQNKFFQDLRNVTREFSGLSRYAVEEVNTKDKKKKKRFMRGLNPQFKVQLRMMRATEFQELVDAAITLEDDFKQLQEEKRKKARFEPKKFISNKPNTGLSFKPRTPAPTHSPSPAAPPLMPPRLKLSKHNTLESMAAQDLGNTEWERSKISPQDNNLLKKLGLSKKKDALRFPGEESYPTPPIGYRVSFVDHLIRGLSAPIHEFLRGLLFVYGLQLHHLTPNSILHISIFITLCECFLGVQPSWARWKRIFFIRPNGSHNVTYNIGGVVICIRPDVEYFDVKFPDSVQGWRRRWLYVREDCSDSLEYNIAPLTAAPKFSVADPGMQRRLKKKKQQRRR
ncbi:hypothetical protein QYE76_012876 [Lolium multiflorum]|uniref:Transposase (putative) gypsy type domain-containing protein n=1 Tax=Lolium multiflorum TaxID=4521 RepID=A0AAD8U2N4_LOLMU|nr:hypothetical protein QYE76_012876 [Lolium multiflorum]